MPRLGTVVFAASFGLFAQQATGAAEGTQPGTCEAAASCSTVEDADAEDRMGGLDSVSLLQTRASAARRVTRDPQLPEMPWLPEILQKPVPLHPPPEVPQLIQQQLIPPEQQKAATMSPGALQAVIDDSFKLLPGKLNSSKTPRC